MSHAEFWSTLCVFEYTLYTYCIARVGNVWPVLNKPLMGVHRKKADKEGSTRQQGPYYDCFLLGPYHRRKQDRLTSKSSYRHEKEFRREAKKNSMQQPNLTSNTTEAKMPDEQGGHFLSYFSQFIIIINTHLPSLFYCSAPKFSGFSFPSLS